MFYKSLSYIRETALPPIVKSFGTTPSERQLSRLTNFSFLSLWAYPNVYRSPGKELCDVLVVCGNNVIVFSDKSISWPKDCSTEIAWGRWYRRAIGHSAKQVQRAVNWIKNHPDRVFLDSACTESFPIEIPRAPNLKIHGVVVAKGASRACRANFDEGSGSLAIIPDMASTNKNGQVPPIPFVVGNPSPDISKIIHILDDISLHVALLELDTIMDLVRYLDKREKLLLNQNLLSADGEEDLIALYLKDIGPDGDHDFVSSSGISLTKNTKIVVQGGSYKTLRSRGEYKRKKAANKSSYLWDRLIETFARNILADTSYIVKGYGEHHSVATREIGLRYMALTPRLERRSHADGIKGAFEKIGEKDRFFRAMLPPTNGNEKTGFFILLVKRKGVLRELLDEDYRVYRTGVTHAYAMNLLRCRRDLERVVGISTEGESSEKLRSEDLIYAEQPAWTDEYEAEIADLAKTHSIFAGGSLDRLEQKQIRPLEYPASHHPQARGINPIPYAYDSAPNGLNRAARRAAKSRQRRK